MHNYLLRFVFILLILSCVTTSVESQTAAKERYTEDAILLQDLYIKANQKKLLGKYDEAAEILGELIEKEPLNASVYHDLARVHLALKEYDDAIKAGKKAIQYEPGNIWYILTLSEIYGYNEDPSNQSITLQKAIAIEPDEGLYGRLAESWLKAKQPQKALEVYQEAMDKFGMSEYWVDEAITTYLNINDAKTAEKLIDNYIKADPTDANRRLKLGEFFMFTNHPDKAKKEFNKVLELDRNNEGAAFNLAMIESQKSTAQSPAGIVQVIEDDRLDVDYKIKQLIPIIDAYAQEASRDMAVAQQLENMAASLVVQYPDQAKVYALQGDLYFIVSDWTRAIQSYQTALNKEKGVYDIWHQLMLSYVYNHNHDQLGELASEAMDYYPNQSGPYYFYGLSRLESGDLEEAQEYVEEAQFISTDQDPNAERITLLSVRIDYESGDLEGAIEQLKSYTDSSSASYQSLELLGDLMKEKGEKTKADKYWKMAIERGGDKERITQKIQAI